VTPERERAIEQICQAALERPTAERARFVIDACGDDGELRREVEALLVHDGAASAFLETPAMAVAAERLATRGAPLNPGERIGNYTILAPLGSGGMGDVYRARDGTLGREVAIKVLPPVFTSDAGRLARFEREARVLAALNHPNIATIHAVEHVAAPAEIHALVLEVVEGETLEHRLDRAAKAGGRLLPLADALAIAEQIAGALEAAHEKGIVHRDLKPANIKIRPDGLVKVLDFGLAKAIGPVEAGRVVGDLSHSPTLTAGATREGVLLGTAAYMSPEQARGEATDQRADIWAFGCVLYEMLTGRMAFAAATATETLAKILEGHADLAALPATTPTPIRRLVRRCLERSPRSRLQHIGDARADLADVRSGKHESSSEPPAGAASASRRRQVIWKAAAAVALVILALAGTWSAASRFASRESDALPVGFEVVRPEMGPSFSGRTLALSPDGSRLVYVMLSSSTLYLRAAQDGNSVPTGIQGTTPFFSPDGLWLAFFSQDGLHRVPAGGGAAQLITAQRSGREREYGGTWGPDGTIVFARGGGLLRVSAEKGEAQVVVDRDTAAGEVFYGWPEFLPDGRSVIFTIVRGGGGADAQIAVVDLTTRQRKILIQGGHGARYLRTGHLLYASGGRLQIVEFDARRLETRGVPSTVEGVRIGTSQPGGFNADFDVSENGTLAYGSAGSPLRKTLAWVDRLGREEPITAAPMGYNYPRISRDGSRVALDIFSDDGNRDIFVWNFKRQVLTRISKGPTEDLMPVWSPDDTRVYYASDRGGRVFRVFSIDAEGAGTEREEFKGTDSYMPFQMPASDALIVFASGKDAPQDVAVLTKGSGGWQSRPLIGGAGAQGTAEVSPDGRLVVYASNESKTDEVIVRSYPDVDRRRESLGGGLQPLWGPAGSNELFYRTLKGELKVVSVRSTPDLDVGAVRDVPLGAGFETPVPGSSWTYAVSPANGRVLLMKRVPGTGVPGPIKVVVNWFEDLKRRQ